MVMATLPVTSDPRPVRAVTARHTIGVEPHTDYRFPTVRMAVVERYAGVLVSVLCLDVDLRDGASLEQVARAHAVMFEADYVGVRPEPAGMHEQTHPLAGQTVQLVAQGVCLVVNWWDLLTGRFWLDCIDSPACGEYAMHIRQSGGPIDNEVVYVKDRNGFGRLVHVTELGEVTR